MTSLLEMVRYGVVEGAAVLINSEVKAAQAGKVAIYWLKQVRITIVGLRQGVEKWILTIHPRKRLLEKRSGIG